MCDQRSGHRARPLSRPVGLAPGPDRPAECRAHLTAELGSQGLRRPSTGAEPIAGVKAAPEADETVLAVGIEHRGCKTLPAILVPDVVQCAHRVFSARVVGLEVLQGAVALGAKTVSESRAARPTIESTSRVRMLAGRLFATKAWRPGWRRSRSARRSGAGVLRAPRKHGRARGWRRGRRTAASPSRLLRRGRSRAVWRSSGRGLAEVLPHGDPEVAAPAGMHDDAGTNLTVVIVEERQAVGLSALPVRFVGDDDGDVGLDPRKQPAQVGVGVGDDIGRRFRPSTCADAVPHVEGIAAQPWEPRPERHPGKRTARPPDRPGRGVPRGPCPGHTALP